MSAGIPPVSRLADLRQKLLNAWDTINRNPLASAAIDTALGMVPFIGPLLKQTYDNISGSQEDVGKLAESLKGLLAQDDAKLSEVVDSLRANTELLRNQKAALDQLLALSGTLAVKLEEVRAQDERVDQHVQAAATQEHADVQAAATQEHADVQAAATQQHADSLRTQQELDVLGHQLMASRVPGSEAGESPEVSVLLKRSRALQVEASESIQATVEGNKQQIGLELARSGTAAETDPFAVIAGHVRAADAAKLRTAFELLLKVEKIDPANVDALLQHVELLYLLQPGDKRERRRIASRAIDYRDTPRDDVQRQQLALAKYFRAINSDPVDLDELRECRSMFASVGRSDYTNAIDELLGKMGTAGPVLPAPPPPGPPAPPPMGAPSPNLFVGLWRIQMGDGRTLVVDLLPEGSLQGFLNQMGLDHTILGRWAPNPMANAIEVQGWVDGQVWYVNRFMLMGSGPAGYSGVDGVGVPFLMGRA